MAITDQRKTGTGSLFPAVWKKREKRGLARFFRRFGKSVKNGDWLAFSGGLEKACLSPLFAYRFSRNRQE